MNKQRYIFAWGNNSKRQTMKGRVCIVLGRMKKNSVVIKFLDNDQIEVVSRNSLRKAIKHNERNTMAIPQHIIDDLDNERIRQNITINL